MKSIVSPSSADKGFSLLELVVVLAILATLAGFIAPVFTTSLRLERTEATVRYMDYLEEALYNYGRDILKFPATLNKLETDTNSGWLGPYAVDRFSATSTAMSGDFRDDAWSQSFEYTKVSNEQCTLRSIGDDGVSGNSDDLVKDLDLTPILREETLLRLKTFNQAIHQYNDANLPANPLPNNFPGLRTELINGNYLPSSIHSTDAWGDAFALKTSNPVTELESANAQ